MTNQSFAAACAIASLLLSFSARPQEIQIGADDCRQPVHLVAREVPLSVILRRLSETLRFDLVYRSQSDPVITADERLTAPQLVQQLAGAVNFSLEQARDARCPQSGRISRLFVLPDTLDGDRSKVAIGSAKGERREAARVRQQTVADYLKSQGIRNQPMEKLAVPDDGIL